MNKKLKFTITTIWILLTRWFDAFSTYRHTPDLGKEANPLVSIFGFGWTPLLVVIVALSIYVIYAYYLATFQTFNLVPSEKGYSFSHFIGYVYIGKKQSWISLFYKFPKDLNRLNHFVGQLLSRCLVFAGFLSTAMWLLINNTEFYKSIHSAPMIYLILIIGSVYIFYRWFKNIYNEYLTSAR
jgi:Kef-type K+ transport system membrane component KefB